MKLSIDSLKKAGAFSGDLVKRTVSWSQNGEDFEAEVFIRPLSYKAVEDVKAGEATSAKRIADHIRNEDGSAVFTVEDITGEADPERGPLGLSLSSALMMAINEVTFGGKKKKS